MAKLSFEDAMFVGSNDIGGGFLTLMNRKGNAMHFIFSDRIGWQTAYRAARDIHRLGFSLWFAKDGSEQRVNFEAELIVSIE